MTETVSGPRKVGYWLHSGGVDPATGQPSVASKLRLQELIDLLRKDAGKGYRQLVFVSGEPTRKSGDYDQATVLEQALQKEMTWPGAKVMNTSMMEAFQTIRREHTDLEALHFVNDNVYMGVYLLKMGLRDEAFVEKVKPLNVPVLTNTPYKEKYSPKVMICTLAGLAMQEALTAVGPFQFLLFLVDRKLNKSTRNPLKLLVIKVVNRFLRNDLR